MLTKGFKPEHGGYLFHVSLDGLSGVVAGQTYFDSTKWEDAVKSFHDAVDPMTPSGPVMVDMDMKKFNDWRLPTKDELNMIFEARNEMPSFANLHYWSSTPDEYSPDSSYYSTQYIGNGTQQTTHKDQYCAVVLVRDVKVDY